MPSKLQVVPFGEITCALLAAFCPLVGCSPPDQLTKAVSDNKLYN